MKKWNLLYLWLIIILFIILWIPYFQNIGVTNGVLFFNGTFSFIWIYPILLFLGVIEGALIVLYVKSLIEDIKKDEPQKFSL